MTNKLNTTTIGKIGEREAAKHLAASGYKIIETNYRYSHREIDIIAENENRLVFVEVKARTDRGDILDKYGRPARAVTKQKQRFLYTAAVNYVGTHRISKSPRFDVIEVYFNPSYGHQEPTVKKICHLENAFLIKRYT